VKWARANAKRPSDIIYKFKCSINRALAAFKESR